MQNFLTMLNLVITIGLIIGGCVAYQHGFARTADEVQDRVINALQHEIRSLQDRLAALEKENTRLSQVIMTIRAALKQRGLHITIDGELVSIHDRSGNFTQTTRIVSSSDVPAQADSGSDNDKEAV